MRLMKFEDNRYRTNDFVNFVCFCSIFPSLMLERFLELKGRKFNTMETKATKKSFILSRWTHFAGVYVISGQKGWKETIARRGLSRLICGLFCKLWKAKERRILAPLCQRSI